MRTSTLVCLFSLALAGCGRQDGDRAAAETADVVTNGICTTLDYGTLTTPADGYRFFADDADAARYVRALEAEGTLARLSGQGSTFREIVRDGHVDRLVAEVFAGFRRAFPRETSGLTTPPPVAIVNADAVQAFAVAPGVVEAGAPVTNRMPWIFFVHSAVLEHDLSDSSLRGLFAHELGHLILRTGLDEVRARVQKVYALTSPSEEGVLGAAQTPDPDLTPAVEHILTVQKRVGGLSSLGLPFLVQTGIYPQYLKQQLLAAPASDACTTAVADIMELRNRQKALLPHLSEGDLTSVPPTMEEQSALDRLSAKIPDEIESCVGAGMASGNFSDIYDSNENLLSIERDLDQSMPNGLLVRKILRAMPWALEELATKRAELNRISPIDRVRIFDFEEDADDASTRVLAAIGDDGRPGGWLLDILSSSPAAAAKCESDVRAGLPIGYGQFRDAHPTACWRYFHATQFAAGLARCNASDAR